MKKINDVLLNFHNVSVYEAMKNNEAKIMGIFFRHCGLLIRQVFSIFMKSTSRLILLIFSASTTLALAQSDDSNYLISAIRKGDADYIQNIDSSLKVQYRMAEISVNSCQGKDARHCPVRVSHNRSTRGTISCIKVGTDLNTGFSVSKRIDVAKLVNDVVGLGPGEPLLEQLAKNSAHVEMIESLEENCNKETVEAIHKLLSDVIDARQYFLHLTSDKNSAEGRALLHARLTRHCNVDNMFGLERTIKDYPECREILEPELNRQREKEIQRESDFKARISGRSDRISGYQQFQFGMKPSDVDALLRKHNNCMQQYDESTKKSGVYCTTSRIAVLSYQAQTLELSGIELDDVQNFNPRTIRSTISSNAKTYGLAYENQHPNDIQLSNGQIQEIVLAAFDNWSIVYFAKLYRDGTVKTNTGYFDNASAQIIKQRWLARQ
ncbi:MAG TPA: hypothetical protein VIF82_19125 [Burkholderiaceae bacterium]